MTFASSQFTPTQWDTAQDKAAFAKQFVRFVQSDFAAKHFTEQVLPPPVQHVRAYRPLQPWRLLGHVLHHAPPTRCGSWSRPSSIRATAIRPGPTATWSGRCRRGSEADGTLERYRQRLAEETEAAERAELARLQQKYA